MKEYLIKLEYGHCGQTEIEADSLEDAHEKASEYAQDGDWFSISEDGESEQVYYQIFEEDRDPDKHKDDDYWIIVDDGYAYVHPSAPECEDEFEEDGIDKDEYRVNFYETDGSGGNAQHITSVYFKSSEYQIEEKVEDIARHSFENDIDIPDNREGTNASYAVYKLNDGRGKDAVDAIDRGDVWVAPCSKSEEKDGHDWIEISEYLFICRRCQCQKKLDYHKLNNSGQEWGEACIQYTR